MVFRSWISVALWSFFLLLSFALVLGAGWPAPLLICLLLSLYALQGLVSDWLGVSADRRGVSAPNRLIGRLPLLTLWRIDLRRGSFNRIDRHGPTSVAIFRGGSPVIVDLPSAEARKKFLSHCKKVFPEVHVTA
ncbi:MAG: hypothetical protein ACR652_19715 [Methylocystis sp.]|uniref:hypothetical protein n=1 Tax=Methylocystis sp. TaxID=1911079 RepID=UPI003DA2A69A